MSAADRLSTTARVLAAQERLLRSERNASLQNARLQQARLQQARSALAADRQIHGRSGAYQKPSPTRVFTRGRVTVEVYERHDNSVARGCQFESFLHPLRLLFGKRECVARVVKRVFHHHSLLALHGRLTRYVAGALLLAACWQLQRKAWSRRAAMPWSRPSGTTGGAR